MSNIRDLTGERFGRLVVLGVSHREGEGDSRKKFWLCQCDCGATKTLHTSRFTRVKSCGCLRNEASSKRSRTHGESTTPEYNAWKAMLARCYNTENPAFYNYGARGITVCLRWRKSFLDFLADVGRRPTSNLSLDRIDNNGDYEPDNVRWATKSQQQSNRRPKSEWSVRP